MQKGADKTPPIKTNREIDLEIMRLSRYPMTDIVRKIEPIHNEGTHLGEARI